MQTAELKKEIDDLKKGLNTGSVEQALRDVKEYAARSGDLNVDTLQLKLMRLEEVARRMDHKDNELFSTVLQHFLCTKKHKKIGSLITSMLATPVEAKAYEKFQKFVKIYGDVEEEKSSSKKEKSSGDEKEVKTAEMEQQYMANMRYQQMFQPFFPFPNLQGRFGYQGNMRPPNNQRRAPRNGQRTGSQGYSGCYKCGDLSHYQYMCPKK